MPLVKHIFHTYWDELRKKIFKKISYGKDLVRFKTYTNNHQEEVNMIFKLNVCDFCSGFAEKSNFEYCQKHCPLKDKGVAKEHESRLIEFYEMQASLVQWAISKEHISPGGNVEIEYNILEPEEETHETTYFS